MERIASLLPSTTEIACALGFTDRLVARSHECDYPAGVASLPALTSPKLDARAPSAAIDRRVKELVGEGLSVYRVDAERLRALAPDVILTQDQCEVCAASPQDLEAALGDWLGAPPDVVSLNPAKLADVWDDIETVAAALGVPERGARLRGEIEERVAAIARTAEEAAAAGSRPSVVCLEWLDPLMAAGNWMPELVALAGGSPLLAEAGAHSPWLDWETLSATDPDVVVALPCGFDLHRTRAELASLADRPAWRGLAAVGAGRVYAADGSQYFNRPGPRLVASLEILAEMLHPDAFPPLHTLAWETVPAVSRQEPTT